MGDIKGMTGRNRPRNLAVDLGISGFFFLSSIFALFSSDDGQKEPATPKQPPAIAAQTQTAQVPANQP